MDHDAITRVVTANGTVPYGVGIRPNPYANKQMEWGRRTNNRALRRSITEKIEAVFEPRFITPPETSELIESIVTITDSRKILEVGMCTGFTSLHILRAIIGKEGAKLYSVDARPAHDRDWFTSPTIKPWFQFVEGWTPQILSTLNGNMFDLVFVDSDHSVEHTNKELQALWPLTRRGTVFLFHDVPEWKSPTQQVSPPIRGHLMNLVADGTFTGCLMPSCEQMDCAAEWGEGYPKECNPGLGIFIRN